MCPEKECKSKKSKLLRSKIEGNIRLEHWQCECYRRWIKKVPLHS